MKIRKAYDKRERVPSYPSGESLTQQSQARECDINFIMKRAQAGTLTHINPNQGIYADLSGSVDYQEALELVIAAGNAFDALDANVRKRFANDPGLFMEFINNPENYDEARKLGLVVKQEAEAPPETPEIEQEMPEA